jgi:TIR domain
VLYWYEYVAILICISLYVFLDLGLEKVRIGAVVRTSGFYLRLLVFLGLEFIVYMPLREVLRRYDMPVLMGTVFSTMAVGILVSLSFRFAGKKIIDLGAMNDALRAAVQSQAYRKHAELLRADAQKLADKIVDKFGDNPIQLKTAYFSVMNASGQDSARFAHELEKIRLDSERLGSSFEHLLAFRMAAADPVMTRALLKTKQMAEGLLDKYAGDQEQLLAEYQSLMKAERDPKVVESELEETRQQAERHGLDFGRVLTGGMAAKNPTKVGVLLEDFFSCFISYSHRDKDFVLRLHDSLKARGIQCWLDEHELLPGDDIYEKVDKAIWLWDKMLLCCSESSLTSWWVDNEIGTALEKEQQLMKDRGAKIQVLVPLNLDGYLFTDSWKSGYQSQIRRRLAADFRDNRADKQKFDMQIERLIRALRIDGGARTPPPKQKL